MHPKSQIQHRLEEQSGQGEHLPSPPMGSAVGIVHIVDSLDIGGTETQMVQVARRLDPHFYHVTVACLRSGGPLTEALREKGIRIVEFPKHRTLLSFQAIYQLFRLAWFLRREKIRVVHSHDLWANLMGVPAAWIARTPVILSSQRNLAHLSWYTPFRRKVIRLIYHLSTGVIANSEAVKNLLVQDFRIPIGRVHVLHNGVDFDRFQRNPGDRRKIHSGLEPETKLIVHVANMNSEVKGHTVLIEAARTVCASIPQAKFVLIGDGPLRFGLERQVQELQLQERVLFLGSRKDVPEILSGGDLFVFPSFAEGLPNSVLEAGASGLPIVATPVGGIPDIIIHGVTGLLVPPRDAQALAESILQVLSNPDLARTLSRACQDRVRTEFSFARLIEGLGKLYEGRPA
jgi:L-malate glycosyltransferase